MPLLHTSIPNLAQGVSQQPDNLRYPGQCDEQINAWSTVVEGLVKRPNTRWVSEFNNSAVTDINKSTPSSTGDPSSLFSHFVKRDKDNKYCVQVSLGGGTPTVGVVDLDSGSNIAVTTTSIAQSYLNGITNPVEDLRALTVVDYTFLVNKKKTVNKLNLISEGYPKKKALIFVKLGDYEKTYTVKINGDIVQGTGHGSGGDYTNSHHEPSQITDLQAATYFSGPSSSGKHADTEYIAKDLAYVLERTYGASSAGETGVTGLTLNTAGSGMQDMIFDVSYPSEFFLKKVKDYGHSERLFFTVNQGSNSSARGYVELVGGSATELVITNRGQGYNTGGATPTLSFQPKYFVHADKTWHDNAVYTSVTLPTATVTLGVLTTYTVTRQASVIQIESRDADSNSEDFDIEVSDGLAEQGLGLIYKEVDNITDLPAKCFDKFVVKIIGDADLEQDDYYVRFKTKDGTEFGEGSWIETIGWKQDQSDSTVYEGIETHFDPNTMPVTLVPVFTGNTITSFNLQSPEEDVVSEPDREVGWRSRSAGDDETNSFPSFVGSKINDVFFFKNRLGFLTDDAVVFSEADEYFNFFRTTTQSLLDSAPIDVGLSHTKVAVLQNALPFQEKLMLFSNGSQFVLRGADILSPKTVAISPVTEYDISDGVTPLALGPYIYFPFNRGQFEGMFEYFVDNNTEVFEAEEITSQVPKYIPTSIRRTAGSASESMVLVQDSTNQNTLYVYKYFWNGKEKIQSAWQKWVFADNITGFDFIDSTLYLILDGKQLVQMPVENALTEEGLDYTLLLDSRISSSDNTYVSAIAYTRSGGDGVGFNGVTQFNVTKITTTGGFVFKDGMAVYTKNGNRRALTISNSVNNEAIVNGQLASYVSDGGTLYKCIQGHTSSSSIPTSDTNYWEVTSEVVSAAAWSDESYQYLSEDDFFIGYEYDMLYRFSKQNLKQPTERGGRSASDYTFQTIRNGSIEYSETGHFTVEVTPKFRDTYTYTYNPTLLASVSTLSKFTPETGFFKFAVQAQPNDATIEVKSSSALPCKLLAAEFESTMIPRSRRYGS